MSGVINAAMSRADSTGDDVVTVDLGEEATADVLFDGDGGATAVMNDLKTLISATFMEDLSNAAREGWQV